MKPDTATTQLRDSAPRAAEAPAVPSDIEAQLAALKAQQLANQEQQAELRRCLWQGTIAEITTRIRQLTTHGFEHGAIAQALGFAGRFPKSTALKTATGPTTQQGWFKVFRNAGVRTYLRTHPDLAATLKSASVSPADYAAHLPADALTAIEQSARDRALTKCADKTASEVPAK